MTEPEPAEPVAPEVAPAPDLAAAFDIRHFPPPCAITAPPIPENPPNNEDFLKAIEYEDRVRSAISDPIF